jgi:hypothetical protein
VLMLGYLDRRSVEAGAGLSIEAVPGMVTARIEPPGSPLAGGAGE